MAPNAAGLAMPPCACASSASLYPPSPFPRTSILAPNAVAPRAVGPTPLRAECGSRHLQVGPTPLPLPGPIDMGRGHFNLKLPNLPQPPRAIPGCRRRLCYRAPCIPPGLPWARADRRGGAGGEEVALPSRAKGREGEGAPPGGLGALQRQRERSADAGMASVACRAHEGGTAAGSSTTTTTSSSTSSGGSSTSSSSRKAVAMALSVSTAGAGGDSLSLGQSAGAEAAVQVEAADSAAMEPASVLAWIDAFWRFCRPHTVIGTALSIISVSLLALPSPSSSAYTLPSAARGILQALIPALCMNVYIVGLNQLCDIEIDKVNKPTLPLASGEFSVQTGATIVTLAAATSVGLGILFNSPPLLATLLVSFALGTAYSIDVPGLRWKRFPVLAAACILAVRAVVVQLGFFLHIQETVLHLPTPVLNVPLVFATAFMCLFSIVIALFKDIPDVAGDKVYGILSLSVRVGQKKVYWLCISILLLAYTAAVAVSLQSPVLWSKILSVSGHVAAAGLLWHRAQQVELSSPASISQVYMFVWKLFYAEYLLLPLLRL